MLYSAMEDLKAPLPKNNKKFFLVALLLLSISFNIGFAVILFNNSNKNNKVDTPKPVIVSSGMDNKKSGLFNARETVYATVTNKGGAGNVIVTFYVTQKTKTYDKTKIIYLSEGQTENIEITFEEVSHFGGKVTYDVECRGECKC